MTVAFVTGAASGIGAETCRRLAASGFHIAAADLNEEQLAAFAATLRASGTRC